MSKPPGPCREKVAYDAGGSELRLKISKGREMSKAAVRGTKRWCQDEACGLPFYDLNRADFSCPNCGAVYKPVAPPVVMSREQRFPRQTGLLRVHVVQPAELESKDEVAADAENEIELEEVDLEKGEANESLLEPDDEDAADLPIHPKVEEPVKDLSLLQPTYCRRS